MPRKLKSERLPSGSDAAASKTFSSRAPVSGSDSWDDHPARRALALNPSSWDDKLARRALAFNPADHGATQILYASHYDASRFAVALAYARRALTIMPYDPDDLHNLGEICRRLGELSVATSHFRRTLVIKPDHYQAFQSLVLTIDQIEHLNRRGTQEGQNREILYLRRVTAIEELSPLAWTALAKLHLASVSPQRYELTDLYLKRSLASAPEYGESLTLLAELNRDLAEPEASMRFYGRALATRRSERIERERLVALLYAPQMSQETRVSYHSAYARRHAPDRPRPAPRLRTDNRIHIGYLSSGFFDHPTGRVFVGLIEGHNRRSIRVSLFGLVAKQDQTTERFSRSSDHWVDVTGKSPPEIAEAIRRAGIDVLVLLASRFDPVCWPVAALRPAPVQVALGDVASTGLSAIDCLMSDRILSPRHTREQSSERVLRLPCLQQHELPIYAPRITPLPALSNGHVTFGSLNNSAKLNDDVLQLWAATVAAVPGSRMRIWAHSISSRRLGDRVLRTFSEVGVTRDRLELISTRTPVQSDVLHFYDGVDIALDTFPWSGGMTTFEAMCQGVPVVTLPGEYMVARWGALYAEHTGHPSLIAKTPEDFIAIARRLASDLGHLAELRARLRDDFVSSPICNGRLKARHVERAYRFMVARADKAHRQ